jgi:urease accessory protein
MTSLDPAMSTEAATLYRLMTWLSPAYPVGGYSYSHGLEAAVEAMAVRDRGSLVAWLTAVVAHGAGAIDAALLAAAWRAAAAADDAALDDVAELADAWRGTAETALESAAQGAAFLATTTKVWSTPTLTAFSRRRDGKASLAVAVGAAAGFHGVALQSVLLAYLQSFAANLVSAGVRLVPLGQTDGQLAMAELEPVIAAAAAEAERADLAELGSAAPVVDWFSIQHETQYTRLFRS